MTEHLAPRLELASERWVFGIGRRPLALAERPSWAFDRVGAARVHGPRDRVQRRSPSAHSFEICQLL